ncbi:MAG: hypothetical protein P8075_05120 [Deltaproteobacteria bacterium]|jgi:S1-C subfamily serine protease
MNGKVTGIVSHILTYSSQGVAFQAGVGLDRSGGLCGRRFSGEFLSPSQEAGLLIQRVAKDSPGQKIGLRPENMPVKIAGKHLLLGGDIVLEIRGVTVSADFRHICQIGQTAGGVKP